MLVIRVASGRLLHVLKAPNGVVADNAALEFSPDGQRLAYATGKAACLWNVKTGEVEEMWALSPGLIDRLSFPKADQLLLLRLETKDGNFGPFNGVDLSNGGRFQAD